MVVKTGLATLLRHYEVCCPQTTSDEDPLKMEPHSFISFVAGGMWLEIKEKTVKN